MGIISTVIGSLVVFVVSLLVGGLGIYVGSQLVANRGDFRTAVWTALFGSLGWTVVALLVGWIPVLGDLLGLLLGLGVYLTIVTVQYDVDWVEAAAITLVAWVSVVVVGTFLGPIGVVGIPLT